MKRIILICIVILGAAAVCGAQSNQTESLTITTYYPSPFGVYRYLSLSPGNSPVGPELSRGLMYYNASADSLYYYNNTSPYWFNVSAGGGSAVSGASLYWNETAAKDIYNNNTVGVGIGKIPDVPLLVYKEDNDPSDALVASFIKRSNGRDQKLHFNLYPSNSWRPYMNSTTVILTPKSPPGNLEFAAGNVTSHIRFNVGGFWEPESEVMRLVNSYPPDPRVGIGTSAPLSALHVENNLETTAPLMIRGMVAGRKSAIFQIAPYKDRVYLTFGMKVRNANFYNDPYTRFNGSTNYEGGKMCIRPGAGPLGDSYKGVWWYAYDAGGLDGSGKVIDWNAGESRLWDKYGTLNCVVTCPSSRKLKENFSGLDLNDILAKIDRLEVSRWKYKNDDHSGFHIGPVAEDFYCLFKTGAAENELNIVDSAGVSLAGVKALLVKARKQEQRLEELGQEIEGLKEQLLLKKSRQ